MTAAQLPIADFVERRRREIDLGKADVASRCVTEIFRKDYDAWMP